MGKTRPNRIGPIDYVESLGFKTFGKERTDPNYIVRRPIFNYKPVSALYTVELQALVGLLVRNQMQGTPIDRSDPNLLSEELDELLKTYGPLIWPEPGRGDRSHLCEPQEGTRYTRDLIYPRDSAILKEYLRAIVLCKRARSKMDLESYIRKIHNDANIPLEIKGRSMEKMNDEIVSQRTDSEKSETDVSSDECENSVSGTKATPQVSNWIVDSPDPPFKIELRLYRSKKRSAPIDPGSTWYYANLMLTDRTKSCEDFFALICDEIEADCSFIIVHLPEDMSLEDRVRIDRGSKESEVVFRRIRGIMQRARRFPCGPLHRSVELEIGLGTD